MRRSRSPSCNSRHAAFQSAPMNSRCERSRTSPVSGAAQVLLDLPFEFAEVGLLLMELPLTSSSTFLRSSSPRPVCLSIALNSSAFAFELFRVADRLLLPELKERWQ